MLWWWNKAIYNTDIYATKNGRSFFRKIARHLNDRNAFSCREGYVLVSREFWLWEGLSEGVILFEVCSGVSEHNSPVYWTPEMKLAAWQAGLDAGQINPEVELGWVDRVGPVNKFSWIGWVKIFLINKHELYVVSRITLITWVSLLTARVTNN